MQDQLHAEYEEVMKQIAYYEEILSNDELCKKVIKDELLEMCIRDRQYLVSKADIRASSKNSLQSSSMYKIMSEPRSAFSTSSIVNSGLPSQVHFTA